MLEEYPEAYLSVSHEVLPLYREFERFSTVNLNAYIGPKVSRYIARFAGAMDEAGFEHGVQLMQSSGGMATIDAAAQRPVNLLMSGPVAGLLGGIWAGKLSGYEDVVTLDIGGTSADIGVAAKGQLRMRHLLDTKIGDYQAMVPMVDIDTIGAGGGSIAYVDEGGVFRVRPAVGGRRSGPGLLRARRHGADVHRRAARARAPAPRSRPARRRHDPRRRPRARGDPAAWPISSG